MKISITSPKVQGIIVAVLFTCCSCTKFKPTNANKNFITSYNNLIKTYEAADTAYVSSLKKGSCRYWIGIFSTGSSDFEAITASDSISFLSAFNDLDTTYLNSFITPLIDDAYVVKDSNEKNHVVFDDSLAFYRTINTANYPPLHLYENTFSSNCRSLLKVDNRFRYPKRGYRDSSFFQQIIFVPVATYTTFDKKNDVTDFDKLTTLAINPLDMREIKAPSIEPKSGYLANLVGRDADNYNDTKSITGTICEVILKKNTSVQCYVFNKESFNKSNPYLYWKVKCKWWFFLTE